MEINLIPEPIAKVKFSAEILRGLLIKYSYFYRTHTIPSITLKSLRDLREPDKKRGRTKKKHYIFTLCINYINMLCNKICLIKNSNSVLPPFLREGRLLQNA